MRVDQEQVTLLALVRGLALMRLSLAFLAALVANGCDRLAADPVQRDRVVPATVGASFTYTPAQVWDGDTFTCSDGRKIRVAGIATREIRIRKEAGEWSAEDAGCVLRAQQHRFRRRNKALRDSLNQQSLSGHLGRMS